MGPLRPDEGVLIRRPVFHRPGQSGDGGEPEKLAVVRRDKPYDTRYNTRPRPGLLCGKVFKGTKFHRSRIHIDAGMSQGVAQSFRHGDGTACFAKTPARQVSATREPRKVVRAYTGVVLNHHGTNISPLFKLSLKIFLKLSNRTGSAGLAVLFGRVVLMVTYKP